MKNNMNVNSIVIWLLLALSLVLLVSCGTDSAPADSTIKFNPTTITASIGFDTCFNSKVSVFYKDGTPMPSAVLTMSGNFADPRQGSGSRYFIYSGPCTNPLNPANLRDGNGFTAVTDDTGAYTYSVVVSVASGTFTDVINAYAGSVYGAQQIAIQ